MYFRNLEKKKYKKIFKMKINYYSNNNCWTTPQFFQISNYKEYTKYEFRNFNFKKIYISSSSLSIASLAYFSASSNVGFGTNWNLPLVTMFKIEILKETKITNKKKIFKEFYLFQPILILAQNACLLFHRERNRFWLFKKKINF